MPSAIRVATGDPVLAGCYVRRLRGSWFLMAGGGPCFWVRWGVCLSVGAFVTPCACHISFGSDYFKLVLSDKGALHTKTMAAEGSVDMLEQHRIELRDLRNTIALLFVELSKMNEKFATQEMQDHDFNILRRHIEVLEMNVENLMKENDEKDARLERLEDEEKARIQNAEISEADFTSACLSPGCPYERHPNGQAIGNFPGHCCLDCKNYNKRVYSNKNHGERCQMKKA